MLGRQSKKIGQYFEDLISMSCQCYEDEGIAKIEKQSEPLEPIGVQKDRYGRVRQGFFIAVYKAKSGVDYKGTLKGGRTVCFEAKHTDTGIMQRTRLADHQIEYLRKYESLGALCFVLLSYDLQSFYAIPFKEWDEMKLNFGKVSLREKDIAKYKIKTMGKRIMFLEGLLNE